MSRGFARHFILLLIAAVSFSQVGHADSCSDKCNQEKLACDGVDNNDGAPAPGTIDPSLPGATPSDGAGAVPDTASSQKPKKIRFLLLCIDGLSAFAVTANCDTQYTTCMKSCTQASAAPTTPSTVATIPPECVSAATAANSACSQNSSGQQMQGQSTSQGGSGQFSSASCDQLKNLNSSGTGMSASFANSCQQSIQNCQSMCQQSQNQDQCAPASNNLALFNSQSSQVGSSNSSGYNACQSDASKLANSGSGNSSPTPSSASSGASPGSAVNQGTGGGGGGSGSGSSETAAAGGDSSIASMIQNPNQSISADPADAVGDKASSKSPAGTGADAGAAVAGSAAGGAAGSGAGALVGTPLSDKQTSNAALDSQSGLAAAGSEGSAGGGRGGGSRGGGFGFVAGAPSGLNSTDAKAKPVFGQQFSPRQLNIGPFKSRDLASATSKGDGITGPETDVFKKITNQYKLQSTKGNFIPE